jgi:hypothetical protein
MELKTERAEKKVCVCKLWNTIGSALEYLSVSQAFAEVNLGKKIDTLVN